MPYYKNVRYNSYNILFIRIHRISENLIYAR